MRFWDLFRVNVHFQTSSNSNMEKITKPHELWYYFEYRKYRKVHSRQVPSIVKVPNFFDTEANSFWPVMPLPMIYLFLVRRHIISIYSTNYSVNVQSYNVFKYTWNRLSKRCNFFYYCTGTVRYKTAPTMWGDCSMLTGPKFKFSIRMASLYR